MTDEQMIAHVRKRIKENNLPYHIIRNKSMPEYWHIKKGNTIICGSLTPVECSVYVKGIEDILTDIELGDYKVEVSDD